MVANLLEVGLLWYSLPTCFMEGLFRVLNKIFVKCFNILQLAVLVIIIVVIIVIYFICNIKYITMDLIFKGVNTNWNF